MANKALSVGRVVSVSVNMTPRAAPRKSFGILLILGDSDVIDAGERIRFYTSIETVAGDFGLDAPEYEAALNYFMQSPTPPQLAIGRWVAQNSPASLKCGILADNEQTMANWTSVTDGQFSINDGGVVRQIEDLDFHLQTNLNGVASIISAAIATYGLTCVWGDDRFTFTTTETGASASIGYLDAGTGDGTNIAAQLKGTADTSLPPIPGYDAEEPEDAVAVLADASSAWYGLTFAAKTAITDDEHIEVAKFIEASERMRMYGITVSDTRILDGTFTTDIASQLKKLGLNRAVTQYCSTIPFAITSLFGRAFTVNFNGSMTTITLKFKQEPGIAYEQITESQAQSIAKKNCNVFVYYNNDTAILQEGVMASGAFFDEIHGLDWLADAIQTELWNVLYTSATKIPQTEEGISILTAVVKAVCEEGVRNGLIGRNLPWNADGFGELHRGDILKAGYYVWTEELALQAQSEREQRKAPPIQIAVKLAGAVHFVEAIVFVNR
ncbi:MAG: DUF3383 domain-containing protein [Synergistaceae bacterium]|jgi:hypothetical protein|nr:DUF3383 domain-containing protein [Synergistaceae bacterium]